MSFIEVCSGAGGLSTGLMNAGLKPILLNDIDPICCKTLSINHPNSIINNEDLNKLNLSQFKNKVDVLAGGVPCQSWSIAGLRNGLSDPRGFVTVS